VHVAQYCGPESSPVRMCSMIPRRRPRRRPTKGLERTSAGVIWAKPRFPASANECGFLRRFRSSLEAPENSLPCSGVFALGVRHPTCPKTCPRRPAYRDRVLGDEQPRVSLTGLRPPANIRWGRSQSRSSPRPLRSPVLLSQTPPERALKCPGKCTHTRNTPPPF